jgi:hypothetical protein
MDKEEMKVNENENANETKDDYVVRYSLSEGHFKIKYLSDSEDQAFKLLRNKNLCAMKLHFQKSDVYYQAGYHEVIYRKVNRDYVRDTIEYYGDVYANYNDAVMDGERLYNDHSKEGVESYNVINTISKVNTRYIGEYYAVTNTEYIDDKKDTDNKDFKTIYAYVEQGVIRIMSESKEDLISEISSWNNINKGAIIELKLPSSDIYYVGCYEEWFSFGKNPVMSKSYNTNVCLSAAEAERRAFDIYEDNKITSNKYKYLFGNVTIYSYEEDKDGFYCLNNYKSLSKVIRKEDN